MEWVLFFFVVIVIIAVVQIVINSKKKKGVDDKLHTLTDFYPSQKLIGEDGETGLALDEKRKKVCLISRSKSDLNYILIDYKDILSSEIFEDGQIITKTSRSSQLGGALIGGLALGGVGIIVGGLSGKKNSLNKIKRVDLRIIVNKTDKPVHSINLLNVEVKKDHILYKTAEKKAQHWHGLLKVLINLADAEDEEKQKEKPRSETHSIADELQKLSDLKEKGIISEAEFIEQKTKLLSK